MLAFSTSVTPGKTTATLLPRIDAERAEQVPSVNNIKHVSDITTKGTSSEESVLTRSNPVTKIRIAPKTTVAAAAIVARCSTIKSTKIFHAFHT